MSSVLSYNQFDFGPIFKHGEKAREEKKREKHQSSFMKQMIYFILFMVLNLGFVLILLLINFVKYLKNLTIFSHIKTQSYNFCLFCQMFQIHRLTISTEVTMMSMDSIKLVDTNGDIHKLTKFQVSPNRWYQY